MNSNGVNLLTDESIGWICSLTAALVWSISISLYRVYGADRTAAWINLFKGLIALFCFGLASLFANSEVELTPRLLSVLAVSGFVGVLIGDCAFFVALVKIGGALTSSIQCLAPPLTAILAWLFLGENLSQKQILGLIITSSFLAALLINESKQLSKNRPISSLDISESNVKPLDLRSYIIGILFALLAAFSQASGVVIARPVLNGLSPILSSSLRLWFPVLCLLIWQLGKSRPKMADFSELIRSRSFLYLAFASVLGSFIGLTLMMKGMEHSPLGVALALNSTYPIWILVGERIFGSSKLNPLSSLLVIGSVAGIWLMI